MQGHQIVARVLRGGERYAPGERVGVPWLGWTDGECRYCRSGRENLCDRAIFTGYGRDGGFAERAVADERFCFSIPEGYPDLQAAPLLCAGLIGFRTLRMAGDAERLGIYGFGAAAHIVCQVAIHEGRRVFAFTRAEDRPAQEFALELGAEWAGDALGPAPEELDAALIFAPAGELVPAALRARGEGRQRRLRRHPHERHPVVPVRAALGRARAPLGGQPDARGRGGVPGARAARAGADQRQRPSRLEEANEALAHIRAGDLRGAAVVVPGQPQAARG